MFVDVLNYEIIKEKLEKLSIIEDNTEFIIESDTDEIMNEENIKTILSIDIGIRHLAFTLVTSDYEYNLIDIAGIDMIDITTFPHHDEKNCKLQHSKTFTDWMEHIFEYYKTVFENVDKILVERQPPMGLVAIEQLIFYKFREKTIIISPNSMHKHFCIGHLDYDLRKKEVEKIFQNFVKTPEVIQEYNNDFDRKHDIADAFCIAKFWLDTKRKEYLKEKEKKRIANIQMSFRNSNLTLNEWFEQFRYHIGKIDDNY